GDVAEEAVGLGHRPVTSPPRSRPTTTTSWALSESMRCPLRKDGPGRSSHHGSILPRARRGSLRLEGADVYPPAHDPGQAALVGAGGVRPVAGGGGGAAGQRAHRLRRAAVVLERAQPRVDGAGGGADLVAVTAVGDARGAAAVADQVVRGAGEQRPEDVGPA